MEFKPGFKAAGHRIVVWPIETEKTTESGIIISSAVTEREDMKQIEAVVVHVGKGCWADKTQVENSKRVQSDPWCEEGDKILMAAYAGLYRKGKDGKQYRIISDLDVVAILED